MDISSIATWAVGLALFLGLFCCPFITWVEERRHFKQISFVRTMVVVQAWIVLTTLEALRLAFCKYVLRQDVRIRAHQSCGAIARFILRTFFDGYAVEGRSEHCPAHVTNEASFPSASPLHSNKTSIGTSGDGSSNNTSTSDSGSSTRSSARSTRSTRSSSSSSGSKEPPHAEALLQRPVVLIANHQSMLDVAAIFALELKVAWVAKTAVFMMPGVGWLMFMAGYVPVERKSSTSIKHMYAACKACVQDGWSLVIFPQGTRSRHGPHLPFKKGAFNLASELELPLLPVSIHIPSDIWLNGSKLTVQMHAPVLGCCDSTLDRVLDATFHTITSTLVHEPAADVAAAAAVAAASAASTADDGAAASVVATATASATATTTNTGSETVVVVEETVVDGVPRQRRRSLRRSSSALQSGNGDWGAEGADNGSSGSSNDSGSGSKSSTKEDNSTAAVPPSSSGQRRGRGTALILKASAQGGLA